MKITHCVAGVICGLLVLTNAAFADQIWDFELTSKSGPTRSVTGFLEFNGSGYQWSDVLSASLAINDQEALSFFVGPNCGGQGCQNFSFDFYPNGKTATADIFAFGQSTSLMINGTDGWFVTDNPNGCQDDNNPCLFTGYWQLEAVPEPGSAMLAGTGLIIFGAIRRRRQNRTLGLSN